MDAMKDAAPAAVLVVIRHGETRWNLEGRIQGHLDSGLTELGLRQAEAIAASFAGERLDGIYSSDLPRALRTAEAVAAATGAPLRPDARLRERHHGVFQGSTLAEVARRFPEDHAAYRARRELDRTIPGGESLRQRHDRAVAFLEEIARKEAGRRVAAITHGGILDSIFRHIVGLDLSAPRRFALVNAARNVLRFRDGAWTLAVWGDGRHLAGLRSASPYEF
jgi:probable phosphoglycerate mutase